MDVYIRRNDETAPIVSVPLEHGRFSVKVPYGDLRVGLFLGPDSLYVLPEKIMPGKIVPEVSVPEVSTASVSASNDLDTLSAISLANREQVVLKQNAGADLSVTLQVVTADTKVEGQLRDTDDVLITGIAGDLVASCLIPIDPAAHRKYSGQCSHCDGV